MGKFTVNRTNLAEFLIILFVLITIYDFFMYLVFIFVYLITPHDLKWHLDTSFYRITVIYLPSLIFLGCLLLGFVKDHRRASNYNKPHTIVS